MFPRTDHPAVIRMRGLVAELASTIVTAGTCPGAIPVALAAPPAIHVLERTALMLRGARRRAARPLRASLAAVALAGVLGACSSAAVPSGPAPTLGAGAAALQVGASSRTSFDRSDLTAPAGAAFAIDFDNNDAGVPHDVAIKDASGRTVFQGKVVTGPAQVEYVVGALAAGQYTFFCAVHPGMHGELTVQ